MISQNATSKRSSFCKRAGAGLAALATVFVTACSGDMDGVAASSQASAGPPAAPANGDPNSPSPPRSDNPRPPGDGTNPTPGPGGEPAPERDRNGNIIPPTGW